MRLVSLCPSITETLAALGLIDRIVGVTRFCVHPEAARSIRKVGGTKDPKLDRIFALAPDLVLMNSEENRREDFEALSARLRVDATAPKRIAEIPALLRHFAALTDTSAEPLAAALEAELAAPAGPSFRFAVLIWRDPVMAVGEDTYTSDLLRTAGGQNVFAARANRYPTVTLEALAAATPDVVLLPDEPFPFAEKHARELAARCPGLRFELCPGDDLTWHGARSLRGLALARRIAREVCETMRPRG